VPLTIRHRFIRCVTSLFVLAVLPAASALAHDAPEGGRLVWSPGGDEWLLRTNRGLIVGDPVERRFLLSCPALLGLPAGEEPELTYLPDGRWLVAASRGLLASADRGCSWQPLGSFADSPASALVRHPSDPKTLYVAIAGAARGGIYDSRDAGATFRKRLNLAADDYVAQLAIAASDPMRVYASGLVIDPDREQFSFQITRSPDGGSTWERSFIPLNPDEDQAILAAVSPKDPNALIVLTHNHDLGTGLDRALYTTDAGKSYRELLRAVKLVNATFSEDGTSALIAGSEGLYRTDATLTNAERTGDSQLMSCVQTRAGALYACGHPNGFDAVNAGVFVSMDDAKTWQSALAFTAVGDMVQCPDGSVSASTAAFCADVLTDWRLEEQVGLGGAPIDSVPGWMDFKGIDGGLPPERMHTLATAKRSSATMTAASSTSPAAIMDSSTPVHTSTDQPPAANSGGCNSVSLPQVTSVWWMFAFIWLARRRAKQA
jgi:photosystem II stability/assembly factor-like uncharacterized protein